jgi:hypothetical protein
MMSAELTFDDALLARFPWSSRGEIDWHRRALAASGPRGPAAPLATHDTADKHNVPARPVHVRTSPAPSHALKWGAAGVLLLALTGNTTLQGHITINPRATLAAARLLAWQTQKRTNQ